MSADAMPEVDVAAAPPVAVADQTGAATRWPPHLLRLLAELRRAPTSFGFFQAVRALERLRPDRSDVGRFVDPASEVVRFSVHPSIAFPPAEIQTLEIPDEGPARMSVNFIGLTGPQGVLPHQYTLLIAERLRARDGAIGAFFDMFHHRLISLFYRAWLKNQVTASYEKEVDDRLSEHLMDLIGEGVQAAQHGLTPLHRMLLFHTGLLAPQTRSAIALEQLVEDVFGVAVEVEQFVGGWYPLAPGDQCALGDESDISTQLGLGVVAGDEVWDQQTRVRVRLGPLSAEEYRKFLPTGSAYELLRWLVRFFSRDAFDFEVQLVLDRSHVSGCTLDDDAAAPQPLGWSTWIQTQAFSRDPDDTILRL